MILKNKNKSKKSKNKNKSKKSKRGGSTLINSFKNLTPDEIINKIKYHNLNNKEIRDIFNSLEHLKGNKNFVSKFLDYITKELYMEDDFIMTIFETLSVDHRKNKEIVLSFLDNIDYKALILNKLYQESSELCSDRELILKCIIDDGTNMQYVQDELIKDIELWKIAVKNTDIDEDAELCLEFLPDDLKNDIDFLQQLLVNNGLVLRYIREDKQTDQMVAIALRQDPNALKYAAKKFRRNPNLVQIAYDKDVGAAYRYSLLNPSNTDSFDFSEFY